jgi:hypothetical protein
MSSARETAPRALWGTDEFLDSTGLRARYRKSLLFDYGTMTPDTHKKEPPLERTVLL